MRAGDALGLLAGLGALNALSGGREGTGKRFTGLMDMLDGGGAGASGDRFEGGGLLSMLGNLFAKPLEAQDNVERIAADTTATNALTETLKDAARKQFDTKTVQDLAAANENAYLQEAYGAPAAPQLSSRLDGKDGDISAGLTDAQKEAIVMGQAMPPAAFDYRNFQQGTEPSTLTENQRMRAAGILAGQAAMEPITQAQLQAGAASEAPASLGISTMGSYKTPEPPKAPDPMGLLTPSSPVQSSLSSLEVPQPPALDSSLQRITGGVSFRDKAEEQLSQQVDSLYIMPAAERERLISERAALLKQTYDQMMRDQASGLGM